MPPQPRRRVSYVIPPPSDPLPSLQLPPHGIDRHGSTAPFLVSSSLHHTIDESPKWTRHPRHRLGVVSLALDTSTQLAGRNTPEGILYTGGRDGLVMSWDLEMQMKKRVSDREGGDPLRRSFTNRWEIMTGWGEDVIVEEADEDDRPTMDGDILGDVKESGSRRRKRFSSRPNPSPLESQWETDLDAFKPGRPAHFRQCAQMHADWVNDLLLCNQNQTVVSASSDGTIKCWNPHSPSATDPSVIGSHTDYVRCLSFCREHNWIASGSFDRTIKLWDLSRTDSADALITLNPPDATAPKSSVYALAADPFGHAIASGSPERVVRLWDPRSGKRTGKLVGHTDNIRAILISEDSKYLLTGSADASIKLWSLASQRCLHTFTHHTDSVWSLFSTHPSLEIFYSGDKSGLVCKVDVEDCSDIGEGECIVLCQDTGDRCMASSEGINKIVAMDDNLLWTASGHSSVKRWRVPQRRAVRASSLVADLDPERRLERLSSFSDSSPPGSSRGRIAGSADTTPRSDTQDTITYPRRNHSLTASLSGSSFASENWMPQRDREDETTLYGIPFTSLVRLASPNDSFMAFSSRGRDPEVATLYSSASVLSVPHATSRSPLQAVFSHRQTLPSNSPMRSEASRTGEETVAPANTARADYEERELAVDAVPLHSVPDDVIHGDHGLVRSVTLNDRIHALTVDTAGEVAVWDIVRGTCVGRFPPQDVAAVSHSGSNGSQGERERSPREALEAVRQRIEGEAVVAQWASVDTKTGVLTVHISERCFEAEVYADEAGFGPERHFADDHRLNIGKWVLRNLFIGFIREEQRAHRRRDSNGHDESQHFNPQRSSYAESNGTQYNRRSSSTSSRKSDWVHSTVITSPKMIPAMSPSVVSLPRASPLLAPMIPLQTGKDPHLSLPSIPQSPFSASNSADATPISRPRRSQTLDSGGPPTVSASSSKDTSDYFSVPLRQPASAGAVPSTPDDFSGWGGPGKSSNDPTVPPTPSTPSTLMGRIKNLNFGKSSSRRSAIESSAPPLSKSVPESSAIADRLPSPSDEPKTPLQTLLSGPISPPSSNEAPTLSLSPNISLLISEEASPGWMTVYRGTVSTTHSDMGALEKAMPMWLLEYLLINKVAPVPVTKISFVLLPWPNKEPGCEQLPELLNPTQSKLTASRFLRVRKLTVHVQDKLKKMSGSTPRSSNDAHPTASTTSLSSSKSHRPRAEDIYEILCNDIVLSLDMTLAAVRQFVWRQTTELAMYYRLKAAPPMPRCQGVPHAL